MTENTPTLGCERRSSHKTNQISAPVDVVEEISHKSPSLLTDKQQLSQHIGLIFISVDITSPPFVIGHSLTDKVVRNALWLLLQCGAWLCRVCQHRLVVSTDIARATHWDSHHPELVPQSSEIFATLLHCNKLGSKGRSLHRRLLLTQEVNQTTVDPHKEASSGSSSLRVRGMISIHLGSYHKALASGLWHVGRQFFHTIQVPKLTRCPVVCVKLGFINHWIAGVIDNLSSIRKLLPLGFVLGNKVLHIPNCSSDIPGGTEGPSLDSIVQLNRTQMTSKVHKRSSRWQSTPIRFCQMLMLGCIHGSVFKSYIQLSVRTVDSYLQGFIFSGVVTAYEVDLIYHLLNNSQLGSTISSL
jgi:hypothetical protein